MTQGANFFDLSALNADNLEQRTVDQLADGFRDLKALKHPETADRYRAEAGYFFAFMRRFGAEPAACTQPHVLRYLDYLASPTHPEHPSDCWDECRHLPYAPSSRQHRLDVLRSFYEYAIANGLPLPANPCAGLSVPVPAVEAIDHLTEWEAHDLWDGAREHSHREGALVALLLGCGMRKEEARLVRIENLSKNAFGPTLKFWRVKRRFWQTINLPAPSAAAIHRQAGNRTAGPLLPSPRWTVTEAGIREKAHLTDAGIDDILKRLAQLTHVRPNDIYSHLGRKTSITMARTIPGLALETTMTFYGHATLKDHQKYDAFARDTFKDPIYNPAQGRGFWRLAI
ncbi:hypothetical protein ABZS53_15170 [Streptomyces sp. NPDC005499]|uniref:tyrosine-type recombinase/integrase n=1 Tax=Streptomyces sp. NPDC005499 TaxID=3154883 RepID=UPI0033A15F2A